MFFLKFNHWTHYLNFILAMSPPFLGYIISKPDQVGSTALIGFAYFIIAIAIPATNKVIDLDKKVDELKERLRKYEPEETTGDESKPNS